MKKEIEYDLVFSPYITLKNGRRIYARQYGKKAFCFRRKREKEEANKHCYCWNLLTWVFGDGIQ